MSNYTKKSLEEHAYYELVDVLLCGMDGWHTGWFVPTPRNGKFCNASYTLLGTDGHVISFSGNCIEKLKFHFNQCPVPRR